MPHTFGHLAPSGGVGQSIGKAELGLQEFMDAADDVGDDRLGRVEHAPLHPLLGVVFLEEQFVEVDDRVFLRVAVVEIQEHRLHVRGPQHFHHVGDPQLVEIERVAIGLPLPPAQVQEGFHQFPQERTGDGHHQRNVIRHKRPDCRETRADNSP